MARKKLIPQITAGYLQTGGKWFHSKEKDIYEIQGVADASEVWPTNWSANPGPVLIYCCWPADLCSGGGTCATTPLSPPHILLKLEVEFHILLKLEVEFHICRDEL